jgi:hypothetical protein
VQPDLNWKDVKAELEKVVFEIIRKSTDSIL